MKLFFLNLLLLFFLWIKLHGSEHKNTQLKIHNPEKFLNKKEEKYQKIMEWFKQNNIQSGNPEEIIYASKNLIKSEDLKEKIDSLVFSQQNNIQNSSILQRRKKFSTE